MAPRLLLDCLRDHVRSLAFEIELATARGDDAAEQVISLAPSITVVSLCLPPWGGLHVIGSLSIIRKDLRVVALLDSDSPEEGSRALRCGAMSWISTADSWERCRENLEAAATGDVRLNDSGGQRPTIADGLSRREHQILNLVYHGRSVQQVAADLTISPRTVKHHLSATYAKLGVHNRTDAVLTALRAGILGRGQASGCSAGASSPFSP